MGRLPLPAALACVCLAACAQPAGNAGADANEATAQADAGGGERFFGQERFTIVMTHSGSQTGTTTTHVRDWGRRRAEINDTALSVAGMNQPTRNRMVYDGARVVTINTDTNTATAITNPLYDQVVAAMRGRSGVDFGAEIMTRMGARRTGEAGSFAGQACDYWELAAVGTRSCVTPWGGTLHIRSALGGITIEQTATAVRLGDGGPDEAFAYDAANVTEAPSLDDIRNRMKGN